MILFCLFLNNFSREFILQPLARTGTRHRTGPTNPHQMGVPHPTDTRCNTTAILDTSSADHQLRYVTLVHGTVQFLCA